jgi:hypothetical protein
MFEPEVARALMASSESAGPAMDGARRAAPGQGTRNEVRGTREIQGMRNELRDTRKYRLHFYCFDGLLVFILLALGIHFFLQGNQDEVKSGYPERNAFGAE